MKKILNLFFLFFGICLPAIAGAQTGATLLVTTDMGCNWKLDGKPMGVLIADDSKAVTVSPGEHLIEAATIDGLTTMRTKVELETGPNTVALQLKTQHDQQSMQRAETPKDPVCADDALNPTWTDPATHLMWTKKDNGSNVDWNQAIGYCSNLRLAGYSDWHLPTLEELLGIYAPSISCRKLFDNGVTYHVHVKGNLILTGWNWSSSESDIPGRPWHLILDRTKPANGFSITASYSMRALCVRHSGES